ncbi:MAG: hypothetical protein AMXMBFR84_03600 [Candidatus Hydrogenedentota bacterium]
MFPGGMREDAIEGQWYWEDGRQRVDRTVQMTSGSGKSMSSTNYAILNDDFCFLALNGLSGPCLLYEHDSSAEMASDASDLFGTIWELNAVMFGFADQGEFLDETIEDVVSGDGLVSIVSVDGSDGPRIGMELKRRNKEGEFFHTTYLEVDPNRGHLVTKLLKRDAKESLHHEMNLTVKQVADGVWMPDHVKLQNGPNFVTIDVQEPEVNIDLPDSLFDFESLEFKDTGQLVLRKYSPDQIEPTTLNLRDGKWVPGF